MREPPPPFDPALLRAATDLRRLGIDPVRERWHRVRRGVWLPPGMWPTLSMDRRYEALVFATLMTCRDPDDVVLAEHAAAVLWGLPSIGRWPDRIQVLVPDGESGPSRHVRTRPGAPVTPVHLRGVRVTPVARTVIDLARWATLDTAVAAADHALGVGLCTRAQLEAEATALPKGARGRATARLVVDLADGLSGSPGESLSRLQMFRANLPRPRLQQHYRDAMGSIGYVDFDFAGVIGEFDGRLKYRIPDGASPAEAGEIVWREKRREDRLRRHKPVARWVWSVARDGAALARLLIDAGVRPQARSTWIDLGTRRPRR
jgi:hypothetical protein